MKIPTLEDVKVGDELVMIYRTGRMLNGKSEDRIERGMVIAAKRVNLTVQALNESRTPTIEPFRPQWVIRRDTGKENANPTMYGWHAYTIERYDRVQRDKAASDYLYQQGVHIRIGPWRGREAELADLLRAHTGQAKEETS